MRTVVLNIIRDIRNNFILSAVPSTKCICRMYDNNSCQFVLKFSPHIINEDTKVYLRFISGYKDCGEVLVEPDNYRYHYSISQLYTTKSQLDVQVILRTEDSESRTNIINFKLGNSLPKPSNFDQNLSLLNRLVLDHVINLKIDRDTDELIIMDDLGNELCGIDLDPSMIPYLNPHDRHGGENCEIESCRVEREDCEIRDSSNWF